MIVFSLYSGFKSPIHNVLGASPVNEEFKAVVLGGKGTSVLFSNDMIFSFSKVLVIINYLIVLQKIQNKNYTKKLEI